MIVESGYYSGWNEGGEFTWADGYLPSLDSLHESMSQKYATRHERRAGGYEQYMARCRMDSNSPDDMFCFLIGHSLLRIPSPSHTFYFRPHENAYKSSKKWNKTFKILSREFEEDKTPERYRALIFVYPKGHQYICEDETHLHPELIRLVRDGVIVGHDFHDESEIMFLAHTKPPGTIGTPVYRIRFHPNRLPQHIHVDKRVGEKRTKEILEDVKFEIKQGGYKNADEFEGAAHEVMHILLGPYWNPDDYIRTEFKKRGLLGRQIDDWSAMRKI